MIVKTSDVLLRRVMYDVFGGKCFYSGQELPFDNFHIDHVVPSSKGGQDSVFNYVLCSPVHNLKKSANIDIDSVNRILYIVKVGYAGKVIKKINEYNPSLEYKVCSKRAIKEEKEHVATWWYSEPVLPLMYAYFGGLNEVDFKSINMKLKLEPLRINGYNVDYLASISKVDLLKVLERFGTNFGRIDIRDSWTHKENEVNSILDEIGL
tara:strand:+ start:778 stop:1401 length:624 start_codon:yes stop_codon:yes gene_type:complete